MSKLLKFNLLNLLAMLVGGLLGAFPSTITRASSSLISDLFLNSLKLLSLPLIFFSVVATITNMNNLREAGILVKKILKYTILTTLLAATVGLILFLILHPCAPSFAEGIPKMTLDTLKQEGYLTFVKKMIPSNIAEAVLENNVIGIASLAAILSIAILRLPEQKRDTLKHFFSAFFDALLMISRGIIALLPIGILAFSYQFVVSMRENGAEMRNLLFYALCVVFANLVQGFVILPIMLKLKGVRPLHLMKAMSPALIMAFFSKSSSATLPLSLESAKTRAGIRESTSGFSFPLCSVINMNGCAAFILITVFFAASSYGTPLSFWQMVPWIFISSIAAIGNAGVPMGCFFLTSALLLNMNLPLHIMGLILPLYTLFDMIETALNIWSDSCVTAVVDKELLAQESEEAALAPN